MELIVADVHRGDARRAVLQQAVGEAARRRADVEAVEPLDGESEMRERALELPAAAAHEALGRLDLDLRVVSHAVAGLGVGDALHAHLPLAHEALRERARLREPARHQQFVETDVHGPRSLAHRPAGGKPPERGPCTAWRGVHPATPAPTGFLPASGASARIRAKRTPPGRPTTRPSDIRP